ncbi:MAG: protein kinase domain-containing protein, partial [Blastocatellia bacterium]
MATLQLVYKWDHKHEPRGNDFRLAGVFPGSITHCLTKSKLDASLSFLDKSDALAPANDGSDLDVAVQKSALALKSPQPADGDPAREAFGEATTLMAPGDPETEETRPLPGATQEGTSEMSLGNGLTRFGSLMGTPLYMSPEQCRGQRLGPQSDIYSLGVVAYQMLSGRLPFTGEMDAVIKAHLEAPPPPLKEVSPKTPKKIATLIMSALAKDPSERPPSAAAFASALRARAEGTGALLRRSFALYSEHFHTFIKVSALSYLPAIILTLFQFGADLLIHYERLPVGVGPVVSGTLNVIKGVVNYLCFVVASGAIV